MARIKLNNKQKEKVENWQFLLGTRSRIVKLIDRTCGYKDAYLEWQKQLNQPNSQIAIINYITRLELTKGGGLRVEETKLLSIDYIQGCIEGKIIPLLPELPPLPLRKVNESLYPRDKREQKPKNKSSKVRQLSIPLSQTEQKLLHISLKSGDKTVYSVEDLLSGREGWYSLEQNREVFLPAPILILLKDFDCSLVECETIVMMAGVMSPQDLLFWVEQIPQMRKMPELEKFTEPVTNQLSRKSIQLSNDRQAQKLKVKIAACN